MKCLKVRRFLDHGRHGAVYGAEQAAAQIRLGGSNLATESQYVPLQAVRAHSRSMNATDRLVRASVFELLVEGAKDVTSADLAMATGLLRTVVTESLIRLADEHRLVLSDDSDRVVMAHPFSTMKTGYRTETGGRAWLANCAWDAFAILSLLGDGRVFAGLPGPSKAVWSVRDGLVEPDGVVHFEVPAARLWDDIGFT